MDIEIESNTVGMNELSNKIELKYANPLHDNVYILANETDNYHLSLIDITGKTVFSDAFKNEYQFSSSKLQSGIYFMKIENQKGDFIIEKVVK